MTEYSLRTHRPAFITRGVDSLLTFGIVNTDTGEALDLTGETVTLTLRNESGGTVYTATASISTTTASVTVPAATTSALEFSAYWTAEWSLDGAVYREQAALIRSDVHCPITATDLTDQAPELIGIEWNDADGEAIPWGRFIMAAYKVFYGRLATVKRWPWKIVNAWAFRSYLVNAALGLCFDSLATDDNARYAEAAKRYRDTAETEWGRIQVLFDEAEDGAPGRRQTTASPVIYLGGSPSGSYYGRF